jgi:hypothetical protein
MISYRRLLFSTLLALGSIVATISIASAEIKERLFTLQATRNQSLENLIQQALDLTQNSVNQEFQGNSELTEITISILAENNGQIVPITRSKISRFQWESGSRIDRLAGYFGNSRMVLGLYNFSPSVKSKVDFIPVIRPARYNVEDDPGFRDD